MRAQAPPTALPGIAGGSPWLIAPLLALAWGLNWPAVKILLLALPPFTMRLLGMGGAALLLLAFAAIRGATLVPQRPAPVLVGGLLTMAGFNLCTAFAQLQTTTSRAAVLTYTMPLMTVLLAWALIGERPTRRSIGALLLGAAGIGVLASPVFMAELPPASVLWPLAAAAFWASGTVAAKRWPMAGDAGVNTGWQLLVGAACALIGWGWAGEPVPTDLPLPVAVALAFHVVVATALAYVLWFSLLKQATAAVASLTTLAVPVVGVIGAMALVGDRPAPVDWLGFALVLAGAAVVLGPARAARNTTARALPADNPPGPDKNHKTHQTHKTNNTPTS